MLCLTSFAGSDSTASTMQSFSHHVLRDQRIYRKLQAELDEATASGALSEMPQWSEVQNLPYFQACLKEAMRVRPAVGLNITRFVPEQGVEIEGVKLPGGTRVAVNAWVLHRDRGVFGQDADVYRPERWIEGDAKAMERCMFQVGRRCIAEAVDEPANTADSSAAAAICALERTWRCWR